MSNFNNNKLYKWISNLFKSQQNNNDNSNTNKSNSQSSDDIKVSKNLSSVDNNTKNNEIINEISGTGNVSITKNEDAAVNKEDSINKENLVNIIYNVKKSNKVWKKQTNPMRTLVLWGWDENKNPGFLIFYGEHKFGSSKSDGYNTLEDDVKYTYYAVFKGKRGHMPSFKAVKIIKQYSYGNSQNKKPNDMYFKTVLNDYWYWSSRDKYKVKEFYNLESKQQFVLPYFISQSYDKYIREIQNQNINFSGFKLAENPNQILKLQGELLQYFEIVVDIFSNQKIYVRKKQLQNLIKMNPPKELYIKLLNIGSPEFISGLFLEFAKNKNPILSEEAQIIIKSEIELDDKNYNDGVIRCAKIYLNSLNDELKENRIKDIRKNLSKMDLHLTKIRDKDVPLDKILNGAAYRKYANSGLLRDYYWTYDRSIRKSIRQRANVRYEEGQYTDGVSLKITNFKNTIQEAEIYELPDVIGKIAYYTDAPRVYYNLKGSSKIKALNYFQRYVKRIINDYAKNSSDKYMTAMKYLCTSYTENDCLCKFKNNFQYNKLLKYYLYYDYKEKAPTGYQNWSKRYDFKVNDQLVKLEGRYEYMKEIWDDNLDIAADIAIEAQIDQVVKACYYILKFSPKQQQFIEKIDYKKLINLCLCTYEPISEMFMSILQSKLEQLGEFDSKLMITLIGSSSEKMHKTAMEYFNNSNGSFSPADTADLLFLDNLDDWKELLLKNLLLMSEAQYMEFIRQVIARSSKLISADVSFSDDIKEVLSTSTDKIQQISKNDKLILLSEIISALTYGQRLPKCMEAFIEEAVFSIPYEELDSLIQEITIEPVINPIPSINKRIISIVEAVKARKIPSDNIILKVLSLGSSKMFKTLISIVNSNSKELENRFSTLLIMLESESTALNLKAQEVFGNLSTEKQKQLHALIIDSPEPKVYTFGLNKLDELYGEMIPEEFIIQMLEHNSIEIKKYISDKTNRIINSFDNVDKDIFMYYIKTLLLLPNKISKGKDKVYNVIPKFINSHKEKFQEIESMLLDIGGSNINIDSERALVALAQIREGVVLNEN